MFLDELGDRRSSDAKPLGYGSLGETPLEEFRNLILTPRKFRTRPSRAKVVLLHILLNRPHPHPVAFGYPRVRIALSQQLANRILTTDENACRPVYRRIDGYRAPQRMRALLALLRHLLASFRQQVPGEAGRESATVLLVWPVARNMHHLHNCFGHFLAPIEARRDDPCEGEDKDILCWSYQIIACGFHVRTIAATRPLSNVRQQSQIITYKGNYLGLQ